MMTNGQCLPHRYNGHWSQLDTFSGRLMGIIRILGIYSINGWIYWLSSLPTLIRYVHADIGIVVVARVWSLVRYCYVITALRVMVNVECCGFRFDFQWLMWPGRCRGTQGWRATNYTAALLPPHTSSSVCCWFHLNSYPAASLRIMKRQKNNQFCRFSAHHRGHGDCAARFLH